jgi:D-alanyl-D-alanine carboxypeptidase
MTLVVSLLPGTALAAQYSAMVVDANTGAVLHDEAGTAPRYPASLTKMMTLYLAFEEIERGRMSYQTKMKVSEHAAAAAPSKLDLEPGDEIAVIDAIKALVTKSANDVAVVFAEHIAGSEPKFAELMTERAHQLGMTSTTFRNASGLPNAEQVTTARDMLTLALRLQDHFPQHYGLFATRAFTYQGRTYSTHNGLLRSFEGTDGIKTGYTRASGFNLVASVRRGERRVIGAIFGGTSTASRNAQMRVLLTRALFKASTTRTRVSPPALIAKAPALVVREARKAEPAAAPASAVPRSVRNVAVTQSTTPALTPASQVESAGDRSEGDDPPAPSIPIARVRPVPMTPEAAPALPQSVATEAAAPQLVAPPRPAVRPPSTLQEQAQQLAMLAAPAGMAGLSAPVAAAAAPAPVTAPSGFQIQIGAYSSSAEAEKAMTSALERATSVLASARPFTTPAQQGGRRLFRARFYGFDAKTAANACTELKRKKIACLIVRPE